MKTNPYLFSLLAAFIGVISPVPVAAQPIDTTVSEPAAYDPAAPEVLPVATEVTRVDNDDSGSFSIVWENDIFNGGDDDGYTNGFRFAWTSPEKGIPEFIRNTGRNVVPGASDASAKLRWSLALGQNMYAPRNLNTRNFIANDRPYAGYTYVSTGLAKDTGQTLDNLLLTVGLIGPASGAEQTQKFIHDVVGADHPMGWHNQVRSRVGVNLDYERKWRNLYEFSPFGLGMDVTPHVGASLGNVTTHALGGATFRLGFDLPADYGPPRIRPSLPGSDFFIPTQDFSGYLFAAVEGRAVAYNVFVDGDTYGGGSSTLDRENYVGSLQGGIVFTHGDTRISYTHVVMTKEFEEQKNHDMFGVLTLSLRF